MATIIVVLIVVAFIAVVVYNRRTSAMLMAGTRFETSASPEEITGALHAAYLQGARAKLRRIGSGVKLAPMAAGLRYQTKLGDTGEVTLGAGSSGSSLVEVRTSEMFVDHPSARRPQRGYWGFAVMTTHRLLTATGYGAFRVAAQALSRRAREAGQQAASCACRGGWASSGDVRLTPSA